MKNELGGVAVAEFVGLKPRMHSILVSDSIKYKKPMGVNKTIAAKSKSKWI